MKRPFSSRSRRKRASLSATYTPSTISPEGDARRQRNSTLNTLQDEQTGPGYGRNGLSQKILRPGIITGFPPAGFRRSPCAAAISIRPCQSPIGCVESIGKFFLTDPFYTVVR